MCVCINIYADKSEVAPNKESKVYLGLSEIESNFN